MPELELLELELLEELELLLPELLELLELDELLLPELEELLELEDELLEELELLLEELELLLDELELLEDELELLEDEDPSSSGKGALPQAARVNARASIDNILRMGRFILGRTSNAIAERTNFGKGKLGRLSLDGSTPLHYFYAGNYGEIQWQPQYWSGYSPGFN